MMNNTGSPKAPPVRQHIGTCHGMSLVSILVALAISGTLINGLLLVFTSHHATSRLIYDFGLLQENSRTAMDLLEVNVRQTGHFGGVSGVDIKPNASLSITGSGNCNQAWLTDTTAPIRGFEGSTQPGSIANFPSGCIETSDYLPNTDILAIKYASGMFITPTSELKNTGIYLRTLIGITPSSEGEIFNGSNTPVLPNHPNTVGTYNFKFSSDIYYLGPCSRKKQGTCQNDIPSLYVKSLQDGTLTEQLISEGVEQMQFEYGVDTDNDRNADQYRSASAVTDWQSVVSVKLNLLIRTNSPDAQHKDTKTYALSSDTSFTPTQAASVYKRRHLTKVVQLRNRVRG
jgi:type IV pilus assembly protein PilW